MCTHTTTIRSHFDFHIHPLLSQQSLKGKNLRRTQTLFIEAKKLTKILPVVVCPDISSPAQSLASVMKVPSNSCFPCRLAFCSFCFGSFGDSSGSLLQHKKAKARHSRTTRRPATNVAMLDTRKHHHFRSVKHFSSSSSSETLAAVVTYAAIGSIFLNSKLHRRKKREWNAHKLA